MINGDKIQEYFKECGAKIMISPLSAHTPSFEICIEVTSDVPINAASDSTESEKKKFVSSLVKQVWKDDSHFNDFFCNKI